MINKLRRFIVALVGFALTTTLYISLMKPVKQLQFGNQTYGYIAGVSAGLIVALIFFVSEPAINRRLKKLGKLFDKEMSAYSQIDIILGSVGLLLGFLIASLISGLLEKIYVVGPVLSIISYVLFGLLGIRIGMRSKNEVKTLLRLRQGPDKKDREEHKSKKQKRNIPPKVLDTSVIIDGRIADICKTGFIEGKLVIPQFVLDELRHIADSADDMKRVRGRRGLDILNMIQEEGNIEVEVTDQDFDDIAEVDIKLLKLASVLKGKVVTNDFNLNNPNKTINPIIQTTLSFQINNVDEKGMYKFKNANTNIWYIYNPTSMYCFAYYDDDYIPDAYGILDWVNGIPIKAVTMTTLYQRYKIYGL